MKYLTVILISIASFCGGQAALATDSGPIPNLVEHPVQTLQTVDIKRLNRWGISLRADDAGGGDYGLYVHVRDPALKLVSSGILEIHFSLWTDKKQFIFGIPSVKLNQRPFLMRDGYVLKLLVNTTGDALGLRPGVGYVIDIDPRELL